MKKVILSDGRSLKNIHLGAIFRTVGKGIFIMVLIAKSAFGDTEK